MLAGPPWLLKAAWGPRVGCCALLCPLVCPCWGVCAQPGPCCSQLLGLRYAMPPATSRLCLGFWGGSLVWPGRCPRPSYGLWSLGVRQLLATREPWRVKKTQPRPVGPRTVAVFVLGLSLRPVPAACCRCHSRGAGMSDPAFKGNPEQKMGRAANWRRRLGLDEMAPALVLSGPCTLPRLQGCVWAALDGSGRLWTHGGALWGPEGLKGIHGGPRGCLGVRAASVAGQRSPPASAWCWPWDFLILGGLGGPSPPCPGLGVWGHRGV